MVHLLIHSNSLNGENNGGRDNQKPALPSNGLAERGVQTVKVILKKIMLDSSTRNFSTTEKLQKLLINYNNTPSTVTSQSPNDHFKEIIKWIPGKVMKRISKFLYVINIKGRIRTAHVNQVKPNRLITAEKASGSLISPDSKEEFVSRKSQRTRRPPDRFGYS